MTWKTLDAPLTLYMESGEVQLLAIRTDELGHRHVLLMTPDGLRTGFGWNVRLKP
jgi:hypothetical protein